MKPLGKSRQTAAKTAHAVLQVLKKEGGQLHGNEVIKKIDASVKFSDWEKERYEKTGNIRWQSILHFYTIDLMKAGYLLKQKGLWILTKEGEEASKMNPEQLLRDASEAYRKWKVDSAKGEVATEEEEDIEENIDKSVKVNIERLEEQSIEGITTYINSLNPYEFQDLVAALLRAMGYFTTYIAAKGKDGGIDIIAYQDPLGSKPPRIKVQVKHKPDSAIPVRDIRSLAGVLSKNGDVGLFVTSGMYTRDSEVEARGSHTHIELIDITRFISLWVEFYSKMPDEDKNRLPIHPIYFLGSHE